VTSLPPAILLGGAANALSVARSLGRRGVPVVALNDEASHVRYSRFGRFVAVPPGADMQQAWLEWLHGHGRREYRGGVLLPCCDDALELLAHHRKELEADFVLAEANDEAVLAMLDKAKTQALSAQAGVPAPRVWQVKDRDELRKILPEVPYPCALKPCHSHLFSRHFPTRKLFVAEKEAQLLEQFEAAARFNLEMLVTEIVTGGDDRYWGYFTYLDEAGRPLLQFIKHKLRQHPVGFGVGTFHISRWEPEVAELGLAFAQRAGLRGMVYVEFKRDARDGALKLIECNPRFTGANELLARCGIDYSLLVYNRLTGRPLPPTDSFRQGVRLLRPAQDFLAFLEYRRRGEITTLSWLRTLLHPYCTPFFSWTDPWPSVVQTARQVRYQLTKRVLAPLWRAIFRRGDTLG
jgi:D-aspartate ligase